MRKVEFRIDFNVDDEAVLQIKYRFFTNDGECRQGRLALDELSSGMWSGFLTFDYDVVRISYGYELVRLGEVVRYEWNTMPHEVEFAFERSSWILYDKWLDSPFANYMQSGLFKRFCMSDESSCNLDRAIFTNECPDVLLFDVPACGLAENETLVLTGDDDVLGCWSPERAVRMKKIAFNRWQCVIDVSSIKNKTINFKFVAFNLKNCSVRWETGNNRAFHIVDNGETVVRRVTVDGIDFSVRKLRMAGTVIPLFSLRSEKSWGVGDFGDLKLFAEWLAATGQHVLQLLPVNDTALYGGECDSYPYNCISVFALHPQYADMSVLPKLKDGRTYAAFLRRAKRLNEKEAFDYSTVNELKEAYLRKLFDENADVFLSNNDYKLFIEKQKEWLEPYCAYRFLTRKIGVGYDNWGKFSFYEKDTCKFLINEFCDAEREMQYYSYVQYLLYSQLKDAHNYALSLGVVLKGDIPIGVAPNGVDVWCDKSLFNRSGSAGAPPDAFSADGQNWGFPTYNWEVMARDGYSWWCRRLKYMANFFDAYRIDHILGFFRIWEIPSCVSSGLSGHFRPSMPLSVEEIENCGFYFDVSRYSCKFLSDLPSDKPADLLFIPDEDSSGYYHPRIMASETDCYKALGERNRQAFDNIYEDFFYHRHTRYWFEEAMKKLAPLLSATTMTACGEDLGMIPECVPWAMKNLQILSLEIQRMPKNFGERFARTENYPYLSVATPSTHDMSTLREWWTENTDDTQYFYNEIIGMQGKAPAELSGNIAKKIISMHLGSPSMLALVAWQDWMAMDESLRRANANDERINIPANRAHVWNYRMHMTIEELCSKRLFNKTLLQMVSESERILK